MIDHNLHLHPLWNAKLEFMSPDEQNLLAYHRAREILQTWDLGIGDISNCSQRFWDCLSDPILAVSGGASNIIVWHVNIFHGTLAPLLRRRPDLQPIIERTLKGDLMGKWLLSEVAHGLDVTNIETTATKVSDGFILHTPHPRAAKFWAPTTPLAGFQKIGIVFAKLVVDNQERGIHPFLVQLTTDNDMCDGITSSLLPADSGSSPLDYAITSFHHHWVPSLAFLGETTDVQANPHSILRHYLERISIGSATIGLRILNVLCCIAGIGADYSYRRVVQGRGAQVVPIISFRTQQLPILRAVAIAHVLRAWKDAYVRFMTDPSTDPKARNGMGTIFKATIMRAAEWVAHEVDERMGSQGMFGYNLVGQLKRDIRSIVTSDGDVLHISIRTFSELLLRRFSLPSPTHPAALLPRHSAGIFSQMTEIFCTLPEGPRDPAFDRHLLPHSERVLLAFGHAFAYSAALDSGVPPPLLTIFELWVIRQDEGWYVENAGLSQAKMTETEDMAVSAAMPCLPQYVNALDVRKYCNIPIQSDEAWDRWAQKLKIFRTSDNGHRNERGHVASRL